MSGALNMQKAIYAALNTHLTYQKGGQQVAVDVRGEVPNDAEFPYVTIGEYTASNWDTNDARGYEFTITIHTWSQANGTTETKLLLVGIDRLLHNQEIVVEGTHLVSLFSEFETMLTEADNITKHGIIRFRARVLN